MIAVYLLAIAAVLFVAARGLYVGLGLHERRYPSSYFGITVYKSEVDLDRDGIDDQTDILQSVRSYIATKPIYKSVYYDGGYPDDGFGVCTDVVAQGHLGAGYDLRALIGLDRRTYPERYEDEPIDDNIDFRRVRNQLVYLEGNAISLTTDIYQLEQWQGGDIVVFENHIGVVSDMRNSDGIALVIHHGSVTQAAYEQDILEERKDEIVGHFRIS